MFSGGAGSWGVARRVADRHGIEDLTLLFADTKMEDEDLYRFLEEAAANIGVPITKIAEGRDPWEVFKDVRFLGNTRIDPCSRILKRELMRKWLDDHCDPRDTVVYLGFDWSEMHRVERASKHWMPWTMQCPLTEKPYKMKLELLDDLATAGIEQPRLYKAGFPHNNCGGFCIKAGQAHFKLLLRTFPERYAYHEKKEQELREFLDKDVAILRDRRGGTLKPLTMKAFREKVQGGQQIDMEDWGSCSCFSPSPEEE